MFTIVLLELLSEQNMFIDRLVLSSWGDQFVEGIKSNIQISLPYVNRHNTD